MIKNVNVNTIVSHYLFIEKPIILI